jgi:hypothetical protein
MEYFLSENDHFNGRRSPIAFDPHTIKKKNISTSQLKWRHPASPLIGQLARLVESQTAQFPYFHQPIIYENAAPVLIPNFFITIANGQNPVKAD